ncbi:MAG TPA: hypothetical protein VFV50_13885 [Bdellovibrionales bacterium]|nr:hypothetical protein [Bdellovibrionales bacterium]
MNRKSQAADERRNSRADRRMRPRKSGGQRQTDTRPYGTWSRADWKRAALALMPVLTVALAALFWLTPGSRASYTIKRNTSTEAFQIPLVAASLRGSTSRRSVKSVPARQREPASEDALASPGRAWLPNPSLLQPDPGPGLEDTELLPEDDVQFAVKTKPAELGPETPQ